MSLMILIITCNRPQLLKQCLDSVLLSLKGCPDLNARVRIGLAQATVETVELVEAYQQKNAMIEVYRMSEKFLPGEARNKGLLSVTDDWIYFIDDDAYVEPGFFQSAALHLKNPGLMAFGGPNLTPKASNFLSQLSQLAFESPFGSGGVFRRYKKDLANAQSCDESSLILCNLFVRASAIQAFPNGKFFDSKLPCAEENHMLWVMKAHGYQMLSDPKLWVWHHRRANLQGLIRQLQKYGDGRGLLIGLYGEYRWFHLLPIALCACFIGTILLQSVSAFGFLTILYTVALFGFTATIWFQKRQLATLSLLFLFPMIHFFYAIGMGRGLLKAIQHRFGIKPLPIHFLEATMVPKSTAPDRKRCFPTEM
jgi:glycosyltransferase involved in cell wall biosynthesis